ncbi:MAG TPA: SDR family NAD(P)-dependent oxidoreductase [Mycobacteriales bacterium]|nr:SDR family NAD(P)-dependent oxidoreductase [Mycobacteriales bacterium]
MTATPGRRERPVALITGASSGIGRAFAERLAADGHDLIVIARRADRLGELKASLEAAHGVRVRQVTADLSTAAGRAEVDAIASGVDVVDAMAPGVDVVVDNAALAHYMPFLQLPADTAEELVQLNVLAPLRLIRAALPGMVERGSGTLISISSLLAFSGAADNPALPARAVYAATKSFLFTFVRLLAEEVHGSGVRLQVVCPGVVNTEFHTRQQLDMSQVPRLQPEQVVQASLTGLELGEVVCLPTVQDLAGLGRRDEAEAELLAAARSATLAPRYVTP